METNAIWLQVFVTVNAATRGSFTEADRSGDPWDVGYQSGKYPWDCSAPYLKKISLGIAFEKIVTNRDTYRARDAMRAISDIVESISCLFSMPHESSTPPASTIKINRFRNHWRPSAVDITSIKL